MTAGLLTLGRWIADRGRVTPDRVAIDFEGREVTYREIDESSRALAAELAGRNLVAGDRVAVLADNCPEYVVLFFACARSGLVITPLNWRLAPPELAFQIRHSGAALLVVSQSREELAAAALRDIEEEIHVRLIDEPAPVASVEPDMAPVEDDDPLFLIYTSGTTGKPKGAVLSHANCFWTNTSIDRLMDVTTFDVVLQILPQFHIGGWNVQPLLAFWKGAKVVLERTFDPGRALKLIESKGVTTLMGVPANYLFMSEHPDFATTDLSSLRMAVVGGAPMPESLIRTWMDRGVALVQGYGLSEAAPNVLGLAPEYTAEKVGYAGKAYPHVEVALRSGDGFVEGEGTGELLVRGPNVFKGYWNDLAASASAVQDGWLRTGDIAERDADGFYRIRDRVKDMYISGGENVYPAEVESVLAEHPDVIEVAVVGVPDERWGEAGVAVVAVRKEVAPETLIEWCQGRIASFKVPRAVRFIDSLPRSGMNKVLKGELATWLEGEDNDDS